MTVNAAIFYLTQNSEVRRTYLKTSLYFLFRHFNSKYKYPVIIFHEGDYDLKSQEDVLMGIRDSCRSLVSFQTLDSDDFKIPSHIDAKRVEEIVSLRPVPYWRNDKYRMMCRWWTVLVHKYAKSYDYIMRLDDDSFIEEPIQKDMFQVMKDKGHVYASNLIHNDCAMCSYGMKEFFEKHVPSKKHMLGELFMASKIPMRAIQCHTFRSIMSINGDLKDPAPAEITAWSPIIYYNNFFITETSFWRQEEVQKLIEEIDKKGSIFYYRWGDAPLHTLIVSLLAGPSKIERFQFKYSKRMQREAFRGDDGHLHCYMPGVYEQSSCMSEQVK